MKLVNRLNKIQDYYHNEIKYIVDFINEIDDNAKSKIDVLAKKQLNQNMISELQSFGEIIEAKSKGGKVKNLQTENPDVY